MSDVSEIAEAEVPVTVSAGHTNPFVQPKYNRHQRRSMAAAQRGSRWVKIVRAATNATAKKAYREAAKAAEAKVAEVAAWELEDALD